MENIAILLSIFSTIVALVSAYLAQFKRGKIAALPIRAYKAVPLNFHVDGNSRRKISLYLGLTFMNTGAVVHAINDLRVRVVFEGKDLIFDWTCEHPDINSDQGSMATQPTLGPYGSISCVYSFVTKSEADSATIVEAIEKAGESNAEKAHKAYLEVRKDNNRWKPIRIFGFQYTGRIMLQTEFDTINVLNKA